MGKTEDFSMILNNGQDLDMSKICGCTTQTLSECENNCSKYYSCNNVAIANDILMKYEQTERKSA